jgi:hypothetical protein
LKSCGLRGRPTTEEVRGILLKLEEVAKTKAQVRMNRNESTLTIKLMKCGPPCQAYVTHTDPQHSKSLPWQNGMTRMQTAEERAGLRPHAHIETLLSQMQALD